MHDTAVLTSCRERASVRRGNGGQRRGRRREGHQTRTSSGPELQEDGTEKARPRLHRRRQPGKRPAEAWRGLRGPRKPREAEEAPATSRRQKRGCVCPWEGVPRGAGSPRGAAGARPPGRSGWEPGSRTHRHLRRKLSWAQKLSEVRAWVPPAPLPGTDSPGSGSTPTGTRGLEAQGCTPGDIALYWLQAPRPAGLARPQARAGAPRAEMKA